MKLNISYPANGTQKLFDIEDDRKVRIFLEKRMGAEVPGDSVGDEFKGYIFKITGGNDKQGFPMKQGVLHPTRVRLLLSAGHSCYRPRRDGERKRKSVRGCIVGMDLAVLALSIIKQGDQDIPGLTDVVLPKRLGPKRATKIRKFFGLSKEDDVRSSPVENAACSSGCLQRSVRTDIPGSQVRKFVVRREVQPKKEGAKPYTKAPKIQRLVTPQRLQRKRHRIALKRRRAESQRDAAVRLSLPVPLVRCNAPLQSNLTSFPPLPERVRPAHREARLAREEQEDRTTQTPSKFDAEGIDEGSWKKLFFLIPSLRRTCGHSGGGRWCLAEAVWCG